MKSNQSSQVVPLFPQLSAEQDVREMKDKLLVSQDSAKEILADSLELFVSHDDKKRRYSCADIEVGSGVKGRTVYTYLNRAGDGSLPSLEKFLSLAKFLGRDFLNKILARIGFYAIPLPAGASADGYDPLVSVRMAGGLIQETVAAAVDGVDRDEAIALLPTYDANIAELERGRTHLLAIIHGPGGSQQ